MMTDITERLDHLITIGVDNEGLAIVKAGIAEIERLRSRVAELEARLEVDHVWVADPDNEDKWIRKEIPPEERADFPCDGIDCRNETIKLQDALIEKQRAKIAELETAVPKPKPREDALDELSRLGQEIDAQLSGEDREAIMSRLTKGRGVHDASAE